MSKLYRVDIIQTMIVVAESEAEAKLVAYRHSKEEANGTELKVFPVKTMADVPDKWQHSCPWGSRNSIRDIISHSYNFPFNVK